MTTDQKFSQATGTIPIEVLRYSSDACRTVTWKWRADALALGLSDPHGWSGSTY